MFLEQQKAMEPWRASGVNALNQLNAMMGLPQYKEQRTATGRDTSGSSRFIPELDRSVATSGGPITAGGSPFGSAMNQALLQAGVIEAKDGIVTRGARDAAPGAPQDWRSLMDPGYEFRKQEGINALAAAGAASGNYGSGNMGVALQDYGQNIASQEFQNVYNRLAGMSGTGQVTSQQIGSMGVNTGGAMANYLNQAGQNIAQGQIAGANALAGGVRDMGQGIASYYMYRNPYSGGGYNLDDYYGGSTGGSWGIPID
jgi:hypothetical protein